MDKKGMTTEGVILSIPAVDTEKSVNNRGLGFDDILEGRLLRQVHSIIGLDVISSDSAALKWGLGDEQDSVVSKIGTWPDRRPKASHRL